VELNGTGERPTVAYVVRCCPGWTQRWEVSEDAGRLVKAEIDRVGRSETSHLPVLDPGSDNPTTLVVAWQHVAAAIVLSTTHGDTPETTTGQYR